MFRQPEPTRLRCDAGIFALESAVNELAEKLHMDPVEIRMKNIVREGMFMPAYFGETANACALDRCIEHCADNFHWKEKYPVRDMGNGKSDVRQAWHWQCRVPVFPMSMSVPVP